ncbi:MAG: dihydrolipoamide acetyltransferase family protein [Candidatus Eisenbacteria bacterium]
MAYDVKLPDIGEGVAEGEIVRWLVKAGDAVKEDQPLVEVMTDKASVEIPAPRTGTIAAIHAAEGALVPVGTVIVSIDVAGAGASGAAPAAAPSPAHAGAAPGAAPAAAGASPAAGTRRVEATPAVRAMAKSLGVDIETLTGTGPRGRVTADDVKAAADARTAGGAKPAAAASPDRAPATVATSSTRTAPAPASPGSRIPLRGLRRKIAEHMRHSLSTAAQFSFVAECDFTALLAHRAGLKPLAESKGVKLTPLAYVFRVLPLVLREYPLLNASLDDERGEIVLHGEHHLGCATNTPDGLTVPIVHHAGRLGLCALAREIERLSKAAREHKLSLDELRGGTFTVTSTGARGGVLATPILHHPQVAILGVHAVTRKPAVVNEQIVIRDLGNLSLSMDHRVVDGAVGADFLYALIEKLQNPLSWLNEGDLP